MKTSSISTGKPAFNARNLSSDHNGDTPSSAQPTHEQIASLAAKLYTQSGCQEGRDSENWLRAEQLLREQAAKKSASPRPPAPRKEETGFERRSRQQL